MLPVPTIQLTNPLMGSIPSPNLHFHIFQYPPPSQTSYTTMMTQDTATSASKINFTSLQPIPNSTRNLTSNQTSSQNAPAPSTCIITISPYLTNLTPNPSKQWPQCPAKDRLSQWPPHPNVWTLPVIPVACELQEHVKAVTLQGWAESTWASYGVVLLVYHIFCNHWGILELDRTPASPDLISTFISVLVGAYSEQLINNYIYRVHTWHTVYSLPWKLHKD